MSEQKNQPQTEPPRPRAPQAAPAPRATDALAVVLSLVWIAGVAVVYLFVPAGGTDDAVRFVMVALSVVLPVAMIWVAATAARTARVMRQESQRLHVAIDALRDAYLQQSRQQAPASEPAIARKLDQIVAAQRKAETQLAMFHSTRASEPAPIRPAPRPEPAGQAGDQVALPLGTPAEDVAPPPDRADFIRALNFPENAEDRDGFAALRRALRDRPTAQLVQAAQDVLTLMSQDGIYMDDLRPDHTRPEVWRRFAAGERGRAIAGLGGVRDRSSLALTGARMRRDAIFRDAAHHFLRLFDRMFTTFAETASDSDISDLADTRTARAFMLLGRVAGTFD